MPKKKPKQGKPEVHDDLKGFDIKINEFGEIVSNYDVEKLNEFLNENVDDKKLRGLEDTGPLEETTEEEEDADPDETLFPEDDVDDDSD
jgi:hypothetical protein